MKSQPKPIDLPLPYETEAFKSAWADFDAHRWLLKREKKTPWTALAGKRILARLEGYGHDNAIKAIDNSIVGGWAGVFDPDKSFGGKSSGVRKLSRVRSSGDEGRVYDAMLQDPERRVGEE